MNRRLDVKEEDKEDVSVLVKLNIKYLKYGVRFKPNESIVAAVKMDTDSQPPSMALCQHWLNPLLVVVLSVIATVSPAMLVCDDITSADGVDHFALSKDNVASGV
ncbi:hypothetical protein CBL_11784 [Carabus blaptoides fortunei]